MAKLTAVLALSGASLVLAPSLLLVGLLPGGKTSVGLDQRTARAPASSHEPQ
jgi:hypothetical protein